mmetsp:Transcript_9879/g.36837  ORF Transcript_9879/g.36837 Transcript_9879/m.36837 type:complete len:203 (+) Transcript_9879:65-673(+)
MRHLPMHAPYLDNGTKGKQRALSGLFAHVWQFNVCRVNGVGVRLVIKVHEVVWLLQDLDRNLLAILESIIDVVLKSMNVPSVYSSSVISVVHSLICCISEPVIAKNSTSVRRITTLAALVLVVWEMQVPHSLAYPMDATGVGKWMDTATVSVVSSVLSVQTLSLPRNEPVSTCCGMCSNQRQLCCLIKCCVKWCVPYWWGET